MKYFQPGLWVKIVDRVYGNLGEVSVFETFSDILRGSPSPKRNIGPKTVVEDVLWFFDCSSFSTYGVHRNCRFHRFNPTSHWEVRLHQHCT